ncbi:MAG: hypothetical protein HOO06_13825 [Bdellovibrionaceae bacterium]|nr:hypothetical protein [Pseudobdellovibrionaceae bacterium]
MNNNTNNFKKFFALGFLVLVTAVSCTRERADKFSDGADDNIYKISFFTNAKVRVSVHPQSQNTSSELSLNETYLIDDDSYEGPSRIGSMFAKLKVMKSKTTNYNVVFKVNEEYLTAFKVMSKVDLTDVEKGTFKPNKEDASTVLVPIFHYAVQQHGNIVPSKDMDGRSTNRLRMESASFEKSTAIRVSNLTKDRIDMLLTEESPYYKSKDVNGRILLASEVKEKLKVKLDVSSDKPLYSDLTENHLNLFQVVNYDELSDLEQKLLDEGEEYALKKCTSSVHKALAKDKSATSTSQVSKDNCYMVLAYEVNVMHGEFKQPQNTSQTALDPSLTFEEVPGLTSVIEISKNTEPRSMRTSDDYIDPDNIVNTDDIIGKEFLYRSTIQDVSNEFPHALPGRSGGLEVVKFELLDHEIKVTSVKALREVQSGTDTDKESILSIPVARYVEKVMVGDDGVKLSKPQYRTVDKGFKGAIAEVDWTSLRMNGEKASATSNLSVCFTGRTSKDVESVDNRLSNDSEHSEGILNFTLVSDYNARDFCQNQYMDWFDRVQSNFRFKERISFKEYIKKSEKSLMDIPYEKQKLLGFGLFTYNKNNTNEDILQGLSGSKIHLPALFDIKNGKQINYVLAGLPKGPGRDIERKALIQATVEVIADWNLAFKKAFKGTDLERPGDVIKLSIEGVSVENSQNHEVVKAGLPGDLDKNYLYLVNKPTKSSVIGTGGSHPNPFSGKIENGSVYQYTGNMLSYARVIKHYAKIKKEYEEIMGQIEVAPSPEEAESLDPDSADVPEEEQAQNSVERTPEASSETLSILDGMPELTNKWMVENKTTPYVLFDKRNKAVGFAKNIRPRELKSSMQQRYERNKRKRWDKFVENNKHELGGEALALFESVQEAASLGQLNQPYVLEKFFNKFAAERLKGELSPDKLERLSLNSKVADVAKQIHDNSIAAHECIYDSAQVNIAAAADALIKFESESDQELAMSDIELMVRIYKPTLAHEIGHNIGFRHNFVASYDKSNWYFKGESGDTTPRNYSSVMDYQPNDHITYDGLGPQDIASIRAAYAGLVELSDQSVADYVSIDDQGSFVSNNTEGSRIKVYNQKYMKIEDYKNIIGLNSWNDLTEEVITALPLKSYKFCSDEDVGLYPTCNRHDNGTTPSEIVDDIIENYKSGYAYRNFAMDRIKFDYWNNGGYIGGVFGRFIKIRQFLEETIYQLITGGSSEEIDGNLNAAIKGMQFFHEVIKTPDASFLLTKNERFLKLSTAEGSFIAERKWLRSRDFGDKTDKMSIRGVEFDKMVALIMLTQRQMGFQRYEQASLRFSYPELEKLLLQSGGASPLEYPTLDLLYSMMSDNVKASVVSPITGRPVNLPQQFKTDTTEMLRAYAIIGAISFLDVDALEATRNMSSLFRISSSKDLKSKLQVTKPGGTLESEDSLKLSAEDGAVIAEKLIINNDALAQLHAKKEELTPLVNKWLDLTFNPEEEAEPVVVDEIIEIEEIESEDGEVVAEEEIQEDGLAPPAEKKYTADEIAEKIDAILEKMPDEIGIKKMDAMGKILLSIFEQGKLLEESLGADIDSNDSRLTIEGVVHQVEYLMKDIPSIGAFASMVDKKHLKDVPVTAQIFNQSLSESHRGINFSNLNTLSRIYFYNHERENR